MAAQLYVQAGGGKLRRKLFVVDSDVLVQQQYGLARNAQVPPER